MSIKINYVLPIVSLIYSVLLFIFEFAFRFSFVERLGFEEIFVYLTISAAIIFLIISTKKHFFVPNVSFFALFLYFFAFWIIMNGSHAWMDFHSGSWFNGLLSIFLGFISGVVLFVLFIFASILTRKSESFRFKKIFGFLIYFFGILFLILFAWGAMNQTNFLYSLDRKIINPFPKENIQKIEILESKSYSQ